MQLSKTKSSSHKMPLKSSRLKDCPYCKSGLTETEKDFFPCTCSFQACIDCYKDIIHNKGLCPTCRSPLRLEKLNTLHASRKEELSKSEVDRLPKKDLAKKTTTVVVTTAPAKKTDNSSTVKSSSFSSNDTGKFSMKKMSLTDLLKVRILQRNLVYVIGLAPKIAKNDILDSFEYFGQYGKIQKIIVNKNNAYNPTSINGPSYSAYITYSNDVEASAAILAVDQVDIYDRTIRASYGTTKYCTFFLRDQACPNPDCLYLHKPGNERDCFMKDEANSNKNVFIDQQKMAVEHLQRHLSEIEKSISAQKSTKTAIFPSLATIRSKVKEYMRENNPEPPKEQATSKIEESKTAAKDQEKPKEKAPEEKRMNHTKSGNWFDVKPSLEEAPAPESKSDLKSETEPSKTGPEESKTDEKKEDTVSEVKLESNRSSISYPSTVENEAAAAEQKEDGGQSQLTQKVEELEGSSATEPKKQEQEDVKASGSGESNNKENDDPAHSLFRSYTRESSDVGLDALSEAPYHCSFDKKIVENLFVNLSNQKSSRFSCAQETSEEAQDEAKFEAELSKAADLDIEFSTLYKSIQDYVDLPTNPLNLPTQKDANLTKKLTDRDENFPQLRTDTNWNEKESFKFGNVDIKAAKSPYSLFNGGFDHNNGPTVLKVSSSEYTRVTTETPGNYPNDQTDKSSSDLNSSMEKKGSNSKSKKSKNKRKKAVSSKSNLETNINLSNNNKTVLGGTINRPLDSLY